MKISVVIQTYNAEEFLERVLKSVQGFDEILICDMYSTDNTIAIAERYNCKIIYHENTGYVEPARAFAIASASHEWVLVLDADELATEELKEFVYQFPKIHPNCEGVRIPRKNFFMGRFMHCAYPDYVLRFFKRDKTTWPANVHSSPKVDGAVLNISKKRKELALIHLSNESIRVTIQKMNKYTDFEYERRKDKKYTCLSLIFEPFVRFLRFYVFKMGFRNGLPGFIWACEYAYYKFITIAKVMEVKLQKKDPDLFK